MNWTKIYGRIPDRVRLSVGGILLAMLVMAAPRLLAAGLRAWS